MIIILSTITVLCLVWILVAFITDDEEMKITSVVVALLIVGVGGWGLIGSFYPTKTESDIVLLDILSNETTVIALDKENKVVFQSSNVSEWNVLRDKKVFPFVKTTKLNIYGGETLIPTYQLQSNE